MMKKGLLFVVCFTVLFKSFSVYAGLFSFFSSKPDWINGTSKKYPETSYLIGVGIAKNLDDARTQARAEIAKIFKVQISQSAASVQSEKSVQSNNAKMDVSGEMASSLETKSFTEGALEGVTVPETWFDDDGNKYYALAVLDKAKTRAVLSDKIVEKEEIIQSQLKALENISSAIEEIKALTKALDAWNSKSFLAEQKRIIDPVSVPDLPSGPSPGEITEKRNNALKKVVFIVQSKAEKEDSHSQLVLNEKITKLGFKVEKTIPKDADPKLTYIIIKHHEAIQYVDRGNPEWKFYNWNSSAEISEKSEGKILASIARDGQESHINEAAAQSKAIFVAEQALSQAVGDWIQENILGIKK